MAGRPVHLPPARHLPSIFSPVSPGVHLVTGAAVALTGFCPPEGGVDGRALLEEVVIILVPQHRAAVLPDSCDGRIEDDGDQAPGKPIVVEVQTCHGAAGLQHQRRVDETRQDPEAPAKMSCDGGQGRAEQPRQLQGGIVRRVVHPVSAQGHAQHHRGDVQAGVLTKGRKPMMVKMPPTVGPFSSPPTTST